MVKSQTCIQRFLTALSVLSIMENHSNTHTGEQINTLCYVQTMESNKNKCTIDTTIGINLKIIELNKKELAK